MVSEAQPTAQQLEDLKFAWRCVKHVKSNAITVAKDGKLLGMGSGQPNRWARAHGLHAWTAGCLAACSSADGAERGGDGCYGSAASTTQRCCCCCCRR